MKNAKYSSSTMNYSVLESRVTLPNFQRRLVWSMNAKKEFIKTLHNGYPFGSILLYKYPEEDGGKYSLIDGLQRFTTIKDFKNNPEKYIDFDHFSIQIFELLNMENANLNTKENTIKEISAIIKKSISDKELKNSEFIKIFKDKYSSTFNSNTEAGYKLVDIFDEIKNYIKEYLNVENITIPYIEFLGQESELAEVFENLNRGGQKLTKYQVFSAQWSSTIINLGDTYYSKEIMEDVIERYNALNDQRKIEITGFDENELKEKNQINLAEFCYAFGKMIIEQTPVFWGESKFSEDLANELGYSWVGAILKIKNTSLSEIIKFKELFSYDDNLMFLDNVIRTSLETFSVINKKFSSLLSLPTSQTESKYEGNAATNFQILSYAIDLYNTKYDLDVSLRKVLTKPNYKSEYSLKINNLIYRYLYDCCSGYWSGTGDKKLDNVSIDNRSRLLLKVDRNELTTALTLWNKEKLSYANLAFDNISKMIVVIVYNLLKYSTAEIRYDYEHIIPKARIKDVYKKFNLPAGSLGNLMLLSENHNRGKKDKTLYENLKSMQELKKEDVENLFYPSEERLAEVMSNLDRRTGDYHPLNLLLSLDLKRL